MDLRHLHYFSVLAEALHFGKAAEQLHISQPPLSRQIAALEQELGVALFERNRRSVRLTPAGERLQRDARDILIAVERAKRNVQAAHTGEDGTLAVGFMFASTYSVLPPLTRAYTSAYPKVELSLSETIPTLLADAIRTGAIDIGIMYPPRDDEQLTMCPIFKEPLVVALPEDHPFAERRSIRIEELRDESFIISPRKASSYIYDIITHFCLAHGFSPRIRLETNFQQTIVNLVGQRLGIALVHRSIGTSRPANVVFKTLHAAPTVEVVLTWNIKNRNPCVDTFVQTALAVVTPSAEMRDSMHPSDTSGAA